MDLPFFIFCLASCIAKYSKGPPPIVAYVDDREITALIDGIVRGMLHDGIVVTDNMKCGDIDPRAEQSHCFSISDKSRAIGGGALEAVLYGLKNLRKQGKK